MDGEDAVSDEEGIEWITDFEFSIGRVDQQVLLRFVLPGQTEPLIVALPLDGARFLMRSIQHELERIEAEPRRTH